MKMVVIFFFLVMTWYMTQSVEFLPCMHEAPCSVPRNPIQLVMEYCVWLYIKQIFLFFPLILISFSLWVFSVEMGVIFIFF